MSMSDIVLINPGDKKQIFQSLCDDISAIEPPYWIALTASFLRERGFAVEIIDANAENLTPSQTARKAATQNPLLCVVIVYGAQPSASTQNMTAAGKICRELTIDKSFKTALGGLHPSALPERTLTEEYVDFVIDGEGLFTLDKLLLNLKAGISKYDNIKGLWWHDDLGNIRHTERYDIIMDLDILPVAAWDLLPMNLYRAHSWHCFDKLDSRQPYAAIYTSFGCPYNCSFCCINAPFGKPRIRYRSTKSVLEEIDHLVCRYGVRNIKIADELFILNERHYLPLLNGVMEKGYDLNIWVYGRVDTIAPKHLPIMKKAGINWIALGIESADDDVRQKSSKKLDNNQIIDIIRLIHESGIRVIGNFIFGLPDDTHESMKKTFDLAVELNCEFANFYSCMAYPGSRLYDTAIENNWELPKSWFAYSQHSYETLPLPTKHISASEVLKFRDASFHSYFTGTKYLNMIDRKFGSSVVAHIRNITSVKLKRLILGD